MTKHKKVALLSMDVEDWYHLDYIEKKPSQLSMLDGFDHFISFVDEHNIPTTLFILTDLLPKLNSKLKNAMNNGHELALHGTSHKRPLEMTLSEFKNDCRKAINVFNENLSKIPLGYRAACFSLDRQRLDILKNNFHLSYDSSRMDFDLHPLYGSLNMNGFKRLTKCVYVKEKFSEFELPSIKFFGRTLPISGGGYLRILPWFIMSFLIKRYIRKNSFFSIYIHPFEMSVKKPPSINGIGILNTFRFKYNINKVPTKMKKLVSLLKKEGFEFMTHNQAQNYYHSINKKL